MARERDAALDEAVSDIADAAEHDLFVVDVHGFEGPLHLLLELARKQKVDLLEVSILELAEQYLSFILEARSQRIDLAADYLLMASWLAFLKSRLLLPKPETPDVSEMGGEEMAERLAFRLARLDAMREAGRDLQALDITGRDVFVRGAPEQTRINRKTTYATSMYDLMKAFGDVTNRTHQKRSHVIRRQPVFALESARKTLKKMTPQLSDWVAIQTFRRPDDEPEETPLHSITASYFAAALELTRDRAVDLRQDSPLSDLYIKRAEINDAGKHAP